MKQNPIVIERSFGSAEGYCDDCVSETLTNWLSHRHKIESFEEIAASIREKYGRFAVINNINVEEGRRGYGLGNELLVSFVGRAGKAPVLLVADTAQEQAEGFDLVAWYKDRGFEVVTHTGSGPLIYSSRNKRRS